MSRHPDPLPPNLGVHFTTLDARAEGISRRRLRSRDLIAPFHGVRRRAADVREQHRKNAEESGPLTIAHRMTRDARSLARAYSVRMSPDSFYCARTVLAMRGLPFANSDALDVGVIGPRRAPRAKGVRGRKVEQRLVDLEDLDGFVVSTVASTWAMLGAELNERELTILADAIIHVPRDASGQLHPERALGTIAELRRALDIPGRPRAERLRAALGRTRVGSASVLESEFRLDAEDAGLPQPDLDVQIFDEHGRRIGVSELVYEEFRVVVEIEGDHHRTSRAQWNRDIDKYQAYADAGWEVIRLTSTHIRSSGSAVPIVRQRLQRNGWDPAAPGPR